ncbi:hypothetical protein [Streptomyces osmaniensis]|uniref:Uncharacterized protein n=1 Tax=Streptomyces osmaniensis TaxID=593134 RepID=A0ABP6YTU6_9ACTN
MFDAGHTHGPTPHFVSDCPLCEAAKGARNQAIEHLSEALYLLAGLRNHDDQPTVRLNLGPIGVTGDDAQRCHSIDLPAKLAEGLADAIDSMTAYAMQDIPVDRDSLARKGAELAAWMEGQTGEAIATGEWSAAAVAQNDPDTWDAVNDAFFELDLRNITKQVLNDTDLDNLTVNRALDDWFGDIPDPELADLYGDEDGDA